MDKERTVTIICSIIFIVFICWRLVPYLKSERDKKYKETTRQYEIQAWQNSYNERKKEIKIYKAMVETNRQEAKVRVTGKMRDQDSNEYRTVKIGDQVWMAENMRATHDRYGHSIELKRHDVTDTDALYRFKMFEYITSWERPDYLYNWKAAMNVCPWGWHLPTKEDWKQLEEYVSSQSKFVCGNNKKNIAKALADTIYWPDKTPREGSSGFYFGSISDYPKANNGTGFSARPSSHSDLESAEFWSATEDDENYAWALFLNGTNAYISLHRWNKIYGQAVRCIKD